MLVFHRIAMWLWHPDLPCVLYFQTWFPPGVVSQQCVPVRSCVSGSWPSVLLHVSGGGVRMSQIVQKALEFLRPHRPHRLYPLCYVSEATRSSAKRLFELLNQEAELSADDVSYLSFQHCKDFLKSFMQFEKVLACKILNMCPPV